MWWICVQSGPEKHSRGAATAAPSKNANNNSSNNNEEEESDEEERKKRTHNNPATRRKQILNLKTTKSNGEKRKQAQKVSFHNKTYV